MISTNCTVYLSKSQEDVRMVASNLGRNRIRLGYHIEKRVVCEIDIDIDVLRNVISIIESANMLDQKGALDV